VKVSAAVAAATVVPNLLIGFPQSVSSGRNPFGC
jgi:hypothetical protein